jgi:hypothetical protein
MADADYNGRGFVHAYPDVYGTLGRMHAAFLQCREAIEKDSEQRRLIPRLLLVRAHSSCLAGMRLCMGGQLLESCVVLRAAVEQAWYALHIAKDPDSALLRTKLWLRRDESQSRLKDEFSIKNVRRTHRELDAVTEKHLHELYQWLIEAGAHPNPMGLLSGLKRTEEPKASTFHVPITCMDTVPLMSTTHKVLAVGVGVLSVYRLIFPERFALMGLDDKVTALVTALNSEFRTYVPQPAELGEADGPR